MGLADIKTAGGHRADEAMSALQKEIRRGHERSALYWALEVNSFNPKALWNRLVIIANDDIGIADLQTVMFVMQTRQMYLEFLASNKKEKILLTNVILAMCRAKKTRIGDHLAMLGGYWSEHERYGVEGPPDYAVDIHTRRGRRMGKTIDDFIEEGSIIENETDEIEDIYRDEAMEMLRTETAESRGQRQERWSQFLRGEDPTDPGQEPEVEERPGGQIRFID